MLCSICKQKEAKFHYTNIAGDKVQKVDLCEDCAKKKGLEDPTGFCFADELFGLGAAQEIEAAARETLARMSGPGVRQALSDELNKAEPPAKAELLRVLGDRGEAGVVSVLVPYADADAEPLRLAALDALRKLAADDSIAPLLELVGKSRDDADLDVNGIQRAKRTQHRRLSGRQRGQRTAVAADDFAALLCHDSTRTG